MFSPGWTAAATGFGKEDKKGASTTGLSVVVGLLVIIAGVMGFVFVDLIYVILDKKGDSCIITTGLSSIVFIP